jgi:hypothetical protein
LEGIDAASMTGPFKALLNLVFERCGLELESSTGEFQERAPLLLSLCFMFAANFLVKLYLSGKEDGIDILNITTGIVCKLVCPARWIPAQLKFKGKIVSWFFFGMVSCTEYSYKLQITVGFWFNVLFCKF